MKTSFRAHWGSYENSVREWMERCSRTSVIERLWKKDPSLWKKDPKEQAEIGRRLGWLEAAETMRPSLDALKTFAEDIRGEGIEKAVLLGMGGSSLAPEVLQSVLGRREGFPELVVLDSTDPGRVADVEKSLDLSKTLFIVSSKSGSTIELVSLFLYFFDKIKALKGAEAGRHFTAITDAGSPLEKLGESHSFKKIFLNPEDVGGRFSALTYFGLVPAALIGLDIQKIVESASTVMLTCSAEVEPEDNGALWLGVAMAVLAEEGRDKVTLVSSPSLEPFGDWAEQLVAESTGKEELGIVPVVREPLGSPDVYGSDRFFVAMLLDSEDNTRLLEKLSALEKAGHPVLVFGMKETSDLGGEFLRWEMATAVACALLKINAFDQPDVQAAKDKTKALLKKVEGGETLPLKSADPDLGALLGQAAETDYIALLAFLPDRPGIRGILREAQARLRAQTKRAVTIGFGPRYLHSTGQLHKGGPNTGLFVIITAESDHDLAIPGQAYGFSQLEQAQAMGDLAALEGRGRRTAHLRLRDLSDGALKSLADALSAGS